VLRVGAVNGAQPRVDSEDAECDNRRQTMVCVRTCSISSFARKGLPVVTVAATGMAWHGRACYYCFLTVVFPSGR